MSKDRYYFSHDSNAKDDPKCVMLIEQLGLEGYGIFWVLIETLRDQPTYRYPVNLLPALARRYNTTQEKMKTVVMQYALFEFENEEFFYSPSLLERMNKYDEKRRNASIAGQKSASVRLLLNNSSTNVQQMFNECSTNVQPNKVKESKVKESKVKESKEIKTALESAIDDFKEFRKKIKSPLTDKAIQLLITSLNKLSTDEETQVAIINQSIINGWKGVFPLKQDKTTNSNVFFELLKGEV